MAGDVTNLPEARLVITASFHVTSIVGSLRILAAVGSSRDAKLKTDAPKVPGRGLGRSSIVTSGRRGGSTSFPLRQFRASIVARKLKAKNMFVDTYRKAVGLTS